MGNLDVGTVDTFTTGTVGPRGQRVFFLQATAPSGIVSLRLEKQQVQAMSDHLENLLADLPEISAQEWTTAPALIEPVEALWTVGVMGGMYDSSSDDVVIIVEEISEDPDSVDAETATFRLGRAQAAAFVERATEVVSAGRPPCPWCSRPLNYGEDGFCPCWN